MALDETNILLYAAEKDLWPITKTIYRRLSDLGSNFILLLKKKKKKKAKMRVQTRVQKQQNIPLLK